MPITIPRRSKDGLASKMFLRPANPMDHRHFDLLLPWATPLLVYAMDGRDWIRWALPKAKAEEYGLADGCSCCGDGRIKPGEAGIEFDTALSETEWWFTANGYVIADTTTINPTEKSNSHD